MHKKIHAMCPLWTEDINTAVIRRRWYTDITEV